MKQSQVAVKKFAVMKQVKIFQEKNNDALESTMNEWLKFMHSTAKKETDSNVIFYVHDTQYCGATESADPSAMITYEHIL